MRSGGGRPTSLHAQLGSSFRVAGHSGQSGTDKSHCRESSERLGTLATDEAGDPNRFGPLYCFGSECWLTSRRPSPLRFAREATGTLQRRFSPLARASEAVQPCYFGPCSGYWGRHPGGSAYDRLDSFFPACPARRDGFQAPGLSHGVPSAYATKHNQTAQNHYGCGRFRYRVSQQDVIERERCSRS